MRQFLGVLAALAFLPALPAQTPQPKPAVDIAKVGPQVGDRAPGFELRDQQGRAHTLKSVLGPNGALLVFYRSAEW